MYSFVSFMLHDLLHDLDTSRPVHPLSSAPKCISIQMCTEFSISHESIVKASDTARYAICVLERE